VYNSCAESIEVPHSKRYPLQYFDFVIVAFSRSICIFVFKGI